MATSQRIDLLDILRVAEQELVPGTLLMKRYQIIKTLGAGRLGIVYLAYDIELKMEIAIKVLNSLVAQDSALMRQLLRQSESLTRVQHPHIVALMAAQSDGERKCLIMEYVDGVSLEATLGRYPDRKLPLETALDYVQQIGEALEYAHARRILHLDLKPKSILRTHNGSLKVSGFGIGRIARALTTRLSSGEAPAALLYLAPEQVQDQSVDARSDVYALGAIFYEMLAGRPPFAGGNIRHAILNDPPARLAGVAEPLNDILLQALAKEKSQRWKSVADMCAALNGVAPRGLPERTESSRDNQSPADEPAEPAARAPESKPKEPSLLDEYRQWMETKDQPDETGAPPRSIYDELKRAEHEKNRLKILEDEYSSERERKEREAILRIEADHFAAKLRQREEQATPEQSLMVRLWSAGITVLMGILLALFVYKLSQEQTVTVEDKTERETGAASEAAVSLPPPAAAALKVRESVLTTIEYNATDAVQDIRISPDTSKVAYKVRQGQRWFVTMGGMAGPGFDAIDQIIFSPDKNKLAYRARQGDQALAVVNQKSGPMFEAVDHLSFSPNGDILAYIASAANKFFVVRNHKKEPDYEWVGHLVFSPDSRRMAYAAKKGERTFVVVGRDRGQPFAGISDLVFSPDSRRLAYVAREGDQDVLVVGNERGQPYSKIAKPVFSPDSRSLAYIAREGNQEFLVVDQKPGPRYDSITALAFAADGQTVTYVARQGGKSFVVSGDKPGPAFDAVSSLAMSPDNQVFAYVARQGGKEFLVLQGQPGPSFDQITGLVFSSDSRQVAYIAKEAGKEFIVVGSKRGPALDEVWQPVFTPDARKIVYGARMGNAVLRVEMSTL